MSDPVVPDAEAHRADVRHTVVGILLGLILSDLGTERLCVIRGLYAPEPFLCAILGFLVWRDPTLLRRLLAQLGRLTFLVPAGIALLLAVVGVAVHHRPADAYTDLRALVILLGAWSALSAVHEQGRVRLVLWAALMAALFGIFGRQSPLGDTKITTPVFAYASLLMLPPGQASRTWQLLGAALAATAGWLGAFRLPFAFLGFGTIYTIADAALTHLRGQATRIGPILAGLALITGLVVATAGFAAAGGWLDPSSNSYQQVVEKSRQAVESIGGGTDLPQSERQRWRQLGHTVDAWPAYVLPHGLGMNAHTEEYVRLVSDRDPLHLVDNGVSFAAWCWGWPLTLVALAWLAWAWLRALAAADGRERLRRLMAGALPAVYLVLISGAPFGVPVHAFHLAAFLACVFPQRRAATDQTWK